MLVILDYGMGNLRSVLRRVEKLGYQAILTSDPEIVGAAGKIIMPGVGAFGSGMQNLKARGLLPILNYKVLEQKTPILGICLGMQLMCNWGEEGDTDGLGWINADCIRFEFTGKDSKDFRVPHMGWNTITPRKECILFDGLEQGTRFYFVHSYFVKPISDEIIAGTTEYRDHFTSVIHQGNLYGTQFHPEKSHMAGAKMLKSFLDKA